MASGCGDFGGRVFEGGRQWRIGFPGKKRRATWCGETEVDVLRLAGIFENFSKLASASRKWRVGKLADSCDGGMFNARVIPGTMECFRILPFDL
jgi:hypothetical protein